MIVTGTDTSGSPHDADPRPAGASAGPGATAGKAIQLVGAREPVPEHSDPLLAGVRRLTLLADRAEDGEAIFRGLARELLLAPGAQEVHVHHLGGPASEDELVVVYLFEGEGRVSYLLPRSERSPAVDWVANSARSFRAADQGELAALVPRVAATGAASCVLLLPVAVRGEIEAVVMLVRRSGDAFASRSIEIATTLVEQGATALALVRARAEAGTDPVTGCMNRRAMRRRLHEEIGRARRTGSPLSCLLVDLDDFKLINDNRGHQAGDDVLHDVGQALVGEFREFDRVARYGGDEFVVILPNADLDSAAGAAARALARLQALPGHGREADRGEIRIDRADVPAGGGEGSIHRSEAEPGVGASIGVAEWRPPMNADALLRECDAALLRSKREGKGRVVRAPVRAR